MLRVSTRADFRFFPLLELLQRISAGGLEQAVAGNSCAGIGDDQRSRHQLRQQVDYRELVDTFVGGAPPLPARGGGRRDGCIAGQLPVPEPRSTQSPATAGAPARRRAALLPTAASSPVSIRVRAATAAAASRSARQQPATARDW